MKIYKKRKSENSTKTFLLGILFSYQKQMGGCHIDSRCFGLYKRVFKGCYIYTYILGIRIKKSVNIPVLFKEQLAKISDSFRGTDFKSIREDIILSVQRSITTALLHQKTFAEFRNKYHDKDVVLVGAGPTLNQFVPIKNAVYVGLNRAFLYEMVHFDYLFTIDKAGLDLPDGSLYNDFFAYDAIKFVGDQNLGPNYQIPYSKFANAENVRHYKTTAGYLGDKIAYDIESQPLANTCSVAIQAMQFIMYTNPKRIYLVGIDCTIGSKGHFTGKAYDTKKRGETLNDNDRWIINSWAEIKNFIQTYYPETEIISINPVGLCGLFHDVYTESYLAEHPEIRHDEVEILKEETK